MPLLAVRAHKQVDNMAAASVYPEASAPPPYEEEGFDVAFKPSEFDEIEKRPLHHPDDYDVEAGMQAKPGDSVPGYVRNDFLKKAPLRVKMMAAARH